MPNLSDIMQIFPAVFPLAGENQAGAVTSRKTGTEQDLGSVTIGKTVLGVNPSGTPTKKFIAGEVDGRAFIYWYILYPNPGALITSMSVPFPASAPVPWQFSNWPNDGWVVTGSGGLLTGLSDLINGNAQCGIYKEANGSLSLRTTMGITGISAKLAIGFIGYVSNN